MSSKLILVIGATGAQGRAVIKALLKPKEDGTPSPYTVRAITRDPASKRAKELAALGVQIVEGAFEDFTSVEKAFEGVYGAWINTDGSTVGEMRENHAGMRIFEIAKRSPSVRHYVYSSLDYVQKKTGYNPDYLPAHYNGKSRVADWMRAQPSTVSDSELSWSIVTMGPYMDMLNVPMFAPLNKRKDGTYVFASPIGDGHAAMISLEDLGWWARYTFDHREETSAKEFEIASQMVDWETLVQTFTRVTGHPAVYKRQSLDEWCANFNGVDKPFATYAKPGDGSITWRENFSAFWRLWRDNIITRDMAWIRSIHPKTDTLEDWMRRNHYNGEIGIADLLKNHENGEWNLFLNWEVTAQL